MHELVMMHCMIEVDTCTQMYDLMEKRISADSVHESILCCWTNNISCCLIWIIVPHVNVEITSKCYGFM